MRNVFQGLSDLHHAYDDRGKAETDLAMRLPRMHRCVLSRCAHTMHRVQPRTLANERHKFSTYDMLCDAHTCIYNYVIAASPGYA